MIILWIIFREKYDSCWFYEIIFFSMVKNMHAIEKDRNFFVKNVINILLIISNYSRFFNF